MGPFLWPFIMYSPQHLFKILCNLKAASLHGCKWKFLCHSCAYLKQWGASVSVSYWWPSALWFPEGCSLLADKGKITPDTVLVGALKCEVNLELPCGRWYGPVCRLSQVEVWLERLMWCGSWEGGFLAWMLCCRWDGSLWDMGENSSSWEPLGVHAWPCDLGVLRGLGALLCLPLPWCDTEISLQLEKWKLLVWNQEWWRLSFVSLAACTSTGLVHGSLQFWSAILSA